MISLQLTLSHLDILVRGKWWTYQIKWIMYFQGILNILLSDIMKLQKKVRNRVFYCLLPNCHSRNLTNLLCNIKTEARFEIEPLNINYPKSLLAVFLIECFPHVLQLGNPPHQKNGKWESSKWFGISWLFSEGRVFWESKVFTWTSYTNWAWLISCYSRKRILVAFAGNPTPLAQLLFSWYYYISCSKWTWG